jgi:hypothetical protein
VLPAAVVGGAVVVGPPGADGWAEVDGAVVAFVDVDDPVGLLAVDPELAQAPTPIVDVISTAATASIRERRIPPSYPADAHATRICARDLLVGPPFVGSVAFGRGRFRSPHP